MTSELNNWRPSQMLEALFAHLPVDDRAKLELTANINGADRFYHGASHLVDLWDCHWHHADGAGFATPEAHRLVACAVAFHDVIYDSRRRDNEDLSAVAWLQVAARCGLARDESDWVADTIRATYDHLGYVANDPQGAQSERLRLWFLDLDLTPLAEMTAKFRLNSRRLRRESPHLTDAAWAEGNLTFLRKIEAAPRIFRSPILFDAYEKRARENITAAIGRSGKA